MIESLTQERRENAIKSLKQTLAAVAVLIKDLENGDEITGVMATVVRCEKEGFKIVEFVHAHGFMLANIYAKLLEQRPEVVQDFLPQFVEVLERMDNNEKQRN